MLDINLIREAPQKVADALAKREYSVDFTELLAWDSERREQIQEIEKLKATRNRVSAEVPVKKKQGEDVSALIEEMRVTGDRIRDGDAALSALEAKINGFLSALPNIPDDDVAAGGKENNVVARVWGERPEFLFEPKNHVDLVTGLGLIDYARGVKLGGNGFWLYKGDGALLEWALLNYFIEEHIKDGYEFVLPPHILTYQSGYTAGQFPKFEEDVFSLAYEASGGAGGFSHFSPHEKPRFAQFMLPTSETALVNIHRDELLGEDDLPKKYFSYTPCYRSEAGSARAEERGMIRGHQFNKIEMFQYTLPEQSDAAFDELVEKAERLVRGLGLHYRMSRLAAADCSASMAKTYDIEVWIPSMGIYKEVSSVSNARDYQARRGNMRVRRGGTKRNEYVHTLNGSGLATSRIFPAILEQFQRADGSVPVPEVLRKWVGKDLLH